MKLKDKVVVITGSSSGIGRTTAIAFAKEGAHLTISYRKNKAGADEVVSEIKKLGSDAVAIQAELTREDDAKNLVEETIKRFGKLDVLVNNAGRYIEGDEWDGTAAIWEQSLKQNFISALSVSKYAIEFMKKQESGVIVNISSRYSVAGQYDAISYAGAKAAIVNITQAYAKLMAPWGRANAVSPGTVRAGYWLHASEKELNENLSVTPLRKLVEPEDIAEAVLFLASDASKMITGQNLIVDGGYTLK